MSDRTYTWFAIPVAALADPKIRESVCRIFNIAPEILAQELAGDPIPDEALGQDDLAVRLVDGVPCLVWEDIEADMGGWDYEDDLQDAGIPYLHRHNAGHEYGPERSTFFGDRQIAIRCDRDGDPIAGVRMVDGHAEVDADELRDLETYTELRARVLKAA